MYRETRPDLLKPGEADPGASPVPQIDSVAQPARGQDIR
jgi:hypothetical protein